MFKIMRACIGVKRTGDLWFNHLEKKEDTQISGLSKRKTFKENKGFNKTKLIKKGKTSKNKSKDKEKKE